MAILSNGIKPDNFESHNSLKLNFTNIRGLHSNFVDCGNFTVGGYLPLIQKDSTTHMHGLTVYMKEGLAFARDLHLENSLDPYLCF